MNPVYVALEKRELDQNIIDRIISFTICPLAEDIKDIISIFQCQRKMEQTSLTTYFTIFTNDYWCFLDNLITDYIPYRARPAFMAIDLKRPPYDKI